MDKSPHKSYENPNNRTEDKAAIPDKRISEVRMHDPNYSEAKDGLEDTQIKDFGDSPLSSNNSNSQQISAMSKRFITQHQKLNLMTKKLSGKKSVSA
jgi:hypothetical protein